MQCPHPSIHRPAPLGSIFYQEHLAQKKLNCTSLHPTLHSQKRSYSPCALFLDLKSVLSQDVRLELLQCCFSFSEVLYVWRVILRTLKALSSTQGKHLNEVLSGDCTNSFFCQFLLSLTPMITDEGKNKSHTDEMRKNRT